MDTVGLWVLSTSMLTICTFRHSLVPSCKNAFHSPNKPINCLYTPTIEIAEAKKLLLQFVIDIYIMNVNRAHRDHQVHQGRQRYHQSSSTDSENDGPCENSANKSNPKTSSRMNPRSESREPWSPRLQYRRLIGRADH